MTERKRYIREARLRQSRMELSRKATKAFRRKQKMWTQEEMDCADVKARWLWRRLHRTDSAEQLELLGEG